MSQARDDKYIYWNLIVKYIILCPLAQAHISMTWSQWKFTPNGSGTPIEMDLQHAKGCPTRSPCIFLRLYSVHWHHTWVLCGGEHGCDVYTVSIDVPRCSPMILWVLAVHLSVPSGLKGPGSDGSWPLVRVCATDYFFLIFFHTLRKMNENMCEKDVMGSIFARMLERKLSTPWRPVTSHHWPRVWIIKM